MKIELFVLNIGYPSSISTHTLPKIAKYADSIGAKFTQITDRKFPDQHVAYEILQIYELGKDNDWNIVIDCDMVIEDGMYDVIPLVPDDGKHVGVWQQFCTENLYYGCGIDVTVVANFMVVAHACHEIFKPLDNCEEHKKYIGKDNNLIEYCLSLNRQKLGYTLAGLELPGAYGKLFKHLNITTNYLDSIVKANSMNAVVTIAIGDAYQMMCQLTHPSLKAYADKIGADFICIDKQKISQTTPHWEKFQIFTLLNKYEHILYLDTDIIIRDDCPNLFDIVPPRFLGAFNEAKFTDRSKELMIDVCKQYDVTLPNWDGRYFNTGVLVISRQHKHLFKKPEKEVCNFYEQTYLNMMIAKEDVPMFELKHEFNRMTCMDRFTGEERFASYIIHYAGVPNVNLVLNLIPMDLATWKRNGVDYKYKRHIYVSVSGGYGDQIAAEPAVRFMRNELYPDDEFVVATFWPRLYEHLKKDGVTVCKQGEANLAEDKPYFIVQSLPGPDKPMWAMVSHLLCHTLDYSAISMMKRTLPVEHKQIKFEVTLNDVVNLFEIIGIQDVSKFIVVHPGKHWDSKTFPVEWWQEVIDKLAESGRAVCIVGKDDAGDHPSYEAGARGTVDVKCPEGSYDLRNLLDIGSFAALLSMADTIITNDSFPVHLAGAFDINIILIPSCKHPDYILPFRHGSQYYKAKALYKRLVIDDIESRPTQVYETSAEVKNVDWNKYLPMVSEVVSTLSKF